eukprot:COSAG02_NODE_24914_length_674_cov_0.944348_1_plen_27_part_10
MNLSLGPCACAGKAGKPDANGKVVYIN